MIHEGDYFPGGGSRATLIVDPGDGDSGGDSEIDGDNGDKYDRGSNGGDDGRINGGGCDGEISGGGDATGVDEDAGVFFFFFTGFIEKVWVGKYVTVKPPRVEILLHWPLCFFACAHRDRSPWYWNTTWSFIF